MMKAKQRKVERWKLSRLKQHPQQAAIFGDVSDVELDALAADMAAHGQREPLDVLPNGTVLAGHQRWRAAKKLRWREIDVVVRHDLVEAGEAAIEDFFVTSNFLRRQLSPLGKARCIQRLMELEVGDSVSQFHFLTRDALKERVGAALGMSARNVSRYLLALQAPIEVQEALDAGRLKLIDVGRVALLDKTTQGKVAKRIAAGEQAATVVRDYLNVGRADDHVHRSFVRLHSALGREVPLLSSSVGQLRVAAIVRRVEVLKQSRMLLDELIGRCQAGR